MLKNRHMLASESGASSVLVIFMMLVLSALGTFAMASAKVNCAYSRRAMDWTAAYYEADALAEEFLARLDARLAAARVSALSDDTPEGLPYEYALEGIESLKDDYPGLTITADEEKITISVNFRAESRDRTNLAVEVELEIAPRGYGVGAEDGIAGGSREAGALPYKITAWTQWQPEPFAEDVPQPIWNGEF